MLPYEFNVRWGELISYCAMLQKLEVFDFNSNKQRTWPEDTEDWASRYAQTYRWYRHDA